MSWRASLERLLRLTEKPHLRRALSRSYAAPLKPRRATDSLPKRWDTLGEVEAPRSAALRNGLLYFHGGAMYLARPTPSCDAVLSGQAHGAAAVLPRYRLAPEHPFPAAIEDAVEAYQAIAPKARVIIGGAVPVAGWRWRWEKSCDWVCPSRWDVAFSPRQMQLFRAKRH